MVLNYCNENQLTVLAYAKRLYSQSVDTDIRTYFMCGPWVWDLSLREQRAANSELWNVKQKYDSVKRRCQNAGSLFFWSVRLLVKILPSRSAGTVLPVADSVLLSYCIVYSVYYYTFEMDLSYINGDTIIYENNYKLLLTSNYLKGLTIKYVSC